PAPQPNLVRRSRGLKSTYGEGSVTHVSILPTSLRHASGWRWTKHQHGIEPAKGKRIRHGVTDFERTSDVRPIIEVAIWIGNREADGRGNEALLDCFDARYGFNPTAGAEEMPVHRLGRGDCELVCCIPKHLFDGSCFIDVIECCRRSVGVEIVDLRRGDARVLQGLAHGLFGTFDIRVDHVLGIGGHAEALEFGEYVGAARLGMLELFQDEDAGAFAKYRSVALFAEWEAAVRRQDANCLPGFHGAVIDGGF